MTLSPINKDEFLKGLEKSENAGSFSRKAAESFFEWMYGNESGYVQVCAFPVPTKDEEKVPRSANKFEHVETKEQFVNVCSEYSGLWRYQVYSGVNTLSQVPKYGRGKLDHIDTVNTVTLDIETKKEPYTGAPKEHVWWSYQYALAQAKYINEWLGVWPMVVMSENGIHLHYKANFPVGDGLLHNRQHIYSKYITERAMDNKYVNHIKDIAPNNVQFDADDVSDVPRVMKVPGTLGIKSKKGRLCGIIHQPNIANVSAIEITDIDRNNIPNYTKNTSESDEIKVSLDPESSKLNSEVKQMVKNHIKDDDLFAALWKGKTLTYKSRSDAEFAFIQKLLSKGYTQKQIQQVMQHSGMSKWSEEGEHYKRKTLERSLEEFDGQVTKDSSNSSLSFRSV